MTKSILFLSCKSPDSMLPVIINGVKLVAFLDPGSSINLMRRDLLAKYKWKSYPSETTITTIDGSHVRATENIEVELQVDDQQRMMTATILREMPFELLIGKPTMRDLRIQWNFGTDEIKCLSLRSKEVIFTSDDLITIFPKLCNVSKKELPLHEIDFLLKPNNNIVACKPYPMSDHKRARTAGKIKEMLDGDIITPSTSEYASPCILVPKTDSSYRLCIDYRQLNRETLLDPFPFPRIDSIINKFGGCRYFTKIDLKGGFWQLGLTKATRKFSAFVTPDGLYEFKRLPLGWKKSSPRFQRVMSEMLADLLELRVVVYIDDICCGAPTLEECASLTYKVLNRLNQYNMTVNLGKCQIYVSEVELLGRIINGNSKQMKEEVIEKAKLMKRPYNLKSLQCFTGFTGHFRAYIPNYATIVRPLDNLKKKYRGDWPKWIKRFERFRQASGLINKPENEQVNMLVYCMGDNVDDILLSCKIASDQLENYAMNSYCSKCKKKGHYAKVCRSEAINEINSEIAFLGSVEDNSKKWIVPIKVNNRQINFKIDTGADVNVLPLQYYYQSFQRIKLEKSDKILQGPNGIPLETVGMIHVELQNKGQHLNSKIYIVDKLKQPLLSGETSEKLNIVRMIQQLSSNFLNPKREFPEIFNGLGHAKINYKISLQPDAKPYALCTPRRVPIPLMKQVEEQLEEMTRLGVIESVEEPNEWCAGMVAVSKPGGKIRICVDLTKLNQYIRRENYPLPATEHILGQLGNACYFSKLDANSGFWQFGFYGKIEGVVCFMDDIEVYGSSLEEHNERVRQNLKKIQEEGITLNPEMCQFGVKTVKFLGHTLSSEGLFIDEEKLDAITKMEAPRSTKELKSFLGMVNYLGKFIPNLADKLQPLNSLLSTKNEWVWDEPQKKSFNLLKQELVSRPNLALFDPSRTTIVSADASSFGLGGVLRQEQPDGSLKPIAYVSRTLSETEKRYSQIEKKGLAIVWTCDRLKDYVTDELEEELAAYIQSIEFPATEERLLEIFRKQKEDSLCSQLAKYCMSGWPKNKREVDPALRGYWQFQEDLTYQNGLLLRGQRILIPKSLRKDILEKLHQGHFGINKCRSRAKESVWWLGISQEIERMVSSCTKCLKERKPKHEPLMPSEFLIRPWQKVGMDLFYLNGRWYLIVCDYYSRYPEISLLQNLTAQEVISRLKSIFARHGTPETMRSDNGPQFQKVLGSEFTKFSKEWSFKHITSSPKFPQSNGFIEAIIKNIKQSFKKEEDCYLTLQAYRTMPLESGYSPAELLMGRRLRTSVPAIESSLLPSKIWKQFIETGTIKRKEGSGRKRKTATSEDRYLVVTAKRHREMTAIQLSNELSSATGTRISRQTVYRRLHEGALYARRPMVCIPLTSAHRRTRLNWCLEDHAWTHDQWANVLFNDESRFSLNTDSRRVFIWREPGTRYHPSNIREIDSFRGGNLLVWAGISSSRRTPLHIFFWGHFNCPKSENIGRMDWPARSPDLNPIEHVWDALGRGIGARHPSPRTLVELRTALLEEWGLLPLDLLQSLVNSIRARCETLIAVR
ncbi:K02A2.6-like, partial [Cordylochernes scorpioides]